MLAAYSQEPLEGRKANYMLNFHVRIISTPVQTPCVCIMQRILMLEHVALAQNRDRWQALVSAVLKHWVP